MWPREGRSETHDRSVSTGSIVATVFSCKECMSSESYRVTPNAYGVSPLGGSPRLLPALALSVRVTPNLKVTVQADRGAGMRKIIPSLLLFVSMSASGQVNVPDHPTNDSPPSSTATAVIERPGFTLAGTSHSFPSAIGNAQADDEVTAATAVISPKPFVVAHKGIFSRSNSFLGITSNINGCDPSALFGQFQNDGHGTAFTYTGGLTGCVTGDASGNDRGIIAVQGFASSKNSASEPVGGSFYGFAAGANGVHAFGTNPLVADTHDSSTNIVLTGEEIDVQPSKGPSNYFALQGLYIRLYNPFNVGGTYRGDAISVQAGTSSSSIPAYWNEGLTFFTSAISPKGVAINIGALGTATASANYDCSRVLNAYEAYWTGSANAFEAWGMQCTIAATGANPSADYFKILHNAGTSPSGQAHYFDLTRGISLELEGASSGSAVLSASATGGTLNLGSANATVTSNGALSVTSCTGCGLPGTIYSAEGTALPTCGSTSNGEQAVVSDAANPAYMAAYKSGGAITAPVICSYNGKSYLWLTH